VKRALSSAGSAIAAHDVLSARNVLLQSTHGTSVPVYQWLSSGRLGLKLSVASRSIGRAGQQSTPTKPVAYGVGNASALRPVLTSKACSNRVIRSAGGASCAEAQGSPLWRNVMENPALHVTLPGGLQT